jgi:hypothetical protein
MPNWCQNRLIVIGQSERIAAFAANNKDENQPLTFAAAVPMPESEKDNWYDWNCANWGTKWDACDVKIDTDEDQGWVMDDPEHVTISYAFDSAWSPPENWFVKLAEQWPDLNLMLNYVELGMGFTGQMIHKADDDDGTWSGELHVSDLLASGFGNYA